MSDFPINYTFVNSRKVTVLADHGAVELDVLVLDKEANDAYFRKVESFSKVVNEAGSPLEGIWELSHAFLDLAVNDLVNEEHSAKMSMASSAEEASSIVPTLLGYRIEFVQSDSPVCEFITPTGRIENNYWK